MVNRELTDHVQDVDPYAFLHEVNEEIHPPESPEDPDAWLNQHTRILGAYGEFENPALTLIEDLAEESEEFDGEIEDTDSVAEKLERDGYLVGLCASLAQTDYWVASLGLEKLDGYFDAVDGEPDEEIEELRDNLEAMAFENSFLMWKNGLAHLMYMNYEPFFRETGFKYLDYHDKIHVSFVVLTATTLVETTLERVLIDLGRDDAPEKDLNDRIDMTVARTELTEDDKEILHALRQTRNLIAHDISHRTDYRATEEVEELKNHFDATFGVTVRALNVATRVLEEVYDFNEPFGRFHENTEGMIESIISELGSD